MQQKDLSELSDQELLHQAKKMKSTALIRAGLVGFMIGVIVWSVAKNTVGLLTLIPLFVAWRLVNGSKDQEALKAVLKERNLE